MSESKNVKSIYSPLTRFSCRLFEYVRCVTARLIKRLLEETRGEFIPLQGYRYLFSYRQWLRGDFLTVVIIYDSLKINNNFNIESQPDRVFKQVGLSAAFLSPIVPVSRIANDRAREFTVDVAHVNTLKLTPYSIHNDEMIWETWEICMEISLLRIYAALIFNLLMKALHPSTIPPWKNT